MADDLWGDLGYKAPAASTQAAAPSEAPAAPDPALKALVASKAAQYGIPADIADRWVHAESSYNPKATSKKGARGLTQLMPKTAESYGVKDVEDPEQNVEGGAHYLADLKKQFGSWDKALAAYNAGPDAVTKAGGVPEIPETQKYVNDILGDHPVAGGGDLWAQLGYNPKAAAPGAGDEAPADTAQFVSYKDVSPAQQKFYAEQVKGNLHDEDAPIGSPHHPYFETADHPLKNTPAGAYVVDKDGKLTKMPGGKQDSSFVAGLEQGAGDVAATLSHIIPGSDDSEIKNTLLGQQKIYGAQYGGDLKSGAGRFIGQTLTSAPLLAGAGEIAAPVLGAAGAPGAFIAGKGGMGAAPLATRLIPRAASLATAGAATGAGAAGLTSSANEGSVGKQMAEGAVGGALLGPAAPAIEAGGASLARGAKALIEPLTKQGPANIANRIVGAFSRPPVGTPNAAEIVPGSTPTLAMATADPGLAQLEQTMRIGPHADQFKALDAKNANARTDLFEKLKGDEDSISALETARDAATKGKREAALAAQTQPADIKPVLDKIDALLAGPEGKQKEVRTVLQEVRENLHDAKGNPETSAAMLYGVRKDINDLLSGKASKDRGSAQLASSQLQAVRGELDNAIQAVAPGFKEYLKDYAALSKPIDEQQFLQSLKMVDLRSQNITLARVQSALDKIKTMRAQPGANQAKSLSDDTIAQLTALRDDLKRENNLSLGKPDNSITGQHFTTGGRMAAAGVPLAGLAAITSHPVAAAAIGAGKLFYGMKDKQIMQEVANRLVNPSPVARPVVSKAKPGLIQRGVNTVVPAVGGMVANRLVPTQ